MAIDPRFNFVVRCPQTANKQQSGSLARKDFFNAIGKVGDIELLNKVGDGKIANGLRTIAKSSNAIRAGDASSAIIGNGISGDSTGANVILAEVGINPQQAQKAGQFNPGVLNRGTAEAQNVYDKAVNGNYKLDDIPNSIQDLENLASLSDGIFTEGATDQNRIELCGAKNYAQALIQYAPKHKFMFILQFTLKQEYATFHNLTQGMAVVVKNSGRPNINIEHEEVNFYNFWSRVPKRTVYEPVTMRFHDDMKNHAHGFFVSYLEAISPISRLSNQSGEYGTVLNYRSLEDNGLVGSGWDVQGTASLGALEGNNTSMIDELRVFHLYDYGRYMTVYNYKNPKILSMNLDDFDMAEGATGNEIEFQFAYDALHISPELSVKTDVEKIKEISGKDITNNGHIEPVFQPGPSASEEGGGRVERPLTEGQSLVERASDVVGGFVDDAKQTAGEVYDAAGGAFDDAKDFFS